MAQSNTAVSPSHNYISWRKLPLFVSERTCEGINTYSGSLHQTTRSPIRPDAITDRKHAMQKILPQVRISVSVLIAMLAGLAITALCYVSARQIEAESARLLFQHDASGRTAALISGLNNAVEQLKVLNQLFRSIDPISREQLRSFSAPLLQRYPEIQAFSYRRVPGWPPECLKRVAQAEVEGALAGAHFGGVADHVGGAVAVAAGAKADNIASVQFLPPSACHWVARKAAKTLKNRCLPRRSRCRVIYNDSFCQTHAKSWN